VEIYSVSEKIEIIESLQIPPQKGEREHLNVNERLLDLDYKILNVFRLASSVTKDLPENHIYLP
jgi:hypothetical protein